jgi:hypothetical protein
MRTTKNGLTVAACLAATMAFAPAAFAQGQIIYDNTSNPLGSRTSPQNVELGDVVTFGAGTSANRLLSEFAFEYFAGNINPNTGISSPLSGNETAQVFIYSVDPNTMTVGSTLFQTTPFTITSGFGTVRVQGFATPLPETVAWTVKFTGFEGNEEAGLLYYNYNPPSVGSSPTLNGAQFIVQKNDQGGFSILDTPNIGGDNLGARFTAVPEPSTFALMVGGLAGLGLLRRRKS